MNTAITPALENYIEGIFIVQNRKRIVRVKDLVRLLRVRAPSVIEAISNLKDRGLVVQEKYGHIELTEEGEALGRRVYNRHVTLKDFFRTILSVESSVAETDACKAEHVISKQTMKRIEQFMSFAESGSQVFMSWLNQFHSLLRQEKTADNESRGKKGNTKGSK